MTAFGTAKENWTPRGTGPQYKTGESDETVILFHLITSRWQPRELTNTRSRAQIAH